MIKGRSLRLPEHDQWKRFTQPSARFLHNMQHQVHTQEFFGPRLHANQPLGKRLFTPVARYPITYYAKVPGSQINGLGKLSCSSPDLNLSS